MGRMSELAIEVSERIREGQLPARVARDLKIPLHWVTEIHEENEYQDFLANRDAVKSRLDGINDWLNDHPTADDYADADAIAYGNM